MYRLPCCWIALYCCFFRGFCFLGCGVTEGKGRLHIIMECLVLIPLESKGVEIRALTVKLSKVGFKVITTYIFE